MVLSLSITVDAKTFIEYADDVFIPHLSEQLCIATKLDIVWDNYIPNYLNESTMIDGEGCLK